MALTSLEKRMLIYVLDFFDGGAEAPKAPLESATVSTMAVSVSVANKNKADIRDGNEYKIPKWLVLKFHGSGHLPTRALPWTRWGP